MKRSRSVAFAVACSFRPSRKPPPRIRKNLYPQPPSTYRIYFRDFRVKIACQDPKPTKLIKTKELAFAKEFPPIN